MVTSDPLERQGVDRRDPDEHSGGDGLGIALLWPELGRSDMEIRPTISLYTKLTGCQNVLR